LKIDLKTSMNPVWFRFQSKANVDLWVKQILVAQKNKGLNVKDESIYMSRHKNKSLTKAQQLNEHLRKESEKADAKEKKGVLTSFKNRLAVPGGKADTQSILSGQSIHTTLPTPDNSEMVYHGVIRVLRKSSLTDSWDSCNAQLYNNGKLAWKGRETHKIRGSLNVSKIASMEKHIKHRNHPLSLRIILKNTQKIWFRFKKLEYLNVWINKIRDVQESLGGKFSEKTKYTHSELRQLYDKHKEEKDSMSLDAFRDAAKVLGLHARHVEDKFVQLDTNHDKVLSFVEFCKVLIHN